MAGETIDLSEFCRTKAQARDFSARLAILSESVYQMNFNLETALAQQFGLQKKEALLKRIRETGAPVTKPTDMKTFLTNLQTQIASLPVLSLVLAFEPTDATLKLLSDWFLLNTKRHILFDISVDPGLLAGVALKYNGRYAEYSIKPAVVKLIQDALAIPAATPPPPPQTASAPASKHPEQFSLGR